MSVSLIFEKFPLFIPINNRNVKLNYQNIYNGKWSNRQRGNIILKCHQYLDIEFMTFGIDNVNRVVKKVKELEKPLTLEVIMYSIETHGGIKMRNDKMIIPEKYCKFDVKNAVDIWAKVIPDFLNRKKFFIDDDIKNINTITTKFITIDNFDNRYISVNLISKKNDK